jgi:hypothetical protein
MEMEDSIRLGEKLNLSLARIFAFFVIAGVSTTIQFSLKEDGSMERAKK